MNTSSERISAVGLAVALGLFLSACGGGDAKAGGDPGGTRPSAEVSAEPGGDGGESQSAEPSESASPTPVPASSEGPAQNWPEPEVPDAIYEESEDGALAALQYWFEAITYLQLTGDYGPIDGVSAPDCETCDNKISQFYDLYEVEDGWYAAEGASSTGELVSQITDDGHASILFELVEGGYSVYGPDGEDLGSVESEVYDAEASLYFDAEKWWISELQIEGAAAR